MRLCQCLVPCSIVCAVPFVTDGSSSGITLVIVPSRGDVTGMVGEHHNYPQACLVLTCLAVSECIGSFPLGG